MDFFASFSDEGIISFMRDDSRETLIEVIATIQSGCDLKLRYVVINLFFSPEFVIIDHTTIQVCA